MTTPTDDQQPTADEAAGMAWFNGLSDWGRGYWLDLARSTVPADAWAEYKRRQRDKAEGGV